MAYDTTEAVAKFLSGFQMEITNRERDTVAPDYYVKYSLTLSKGGKDFSTTFVSDPRAFGEPTGTLTMPAHASSLPAGGACISSIPVNPARMAAYQKARMKIPPAVTRWSSSTIPRITGSS